MSFLISRAAFARRAGVSKPAITKACRHQLAAACVGTKIDAAHPAVVQYLSDKGGALTPEPTPPKKPTSKLTSAPPPRRKVAPAAPSEPTAPKKPGPKPPSEPTPNALGLTDDQLMSMPRGTNEELASYKKRIGPLVQRFGGEQPFKLFLEAMLRIESILKIRLENDVKAGRVVEREWIEKQIFGVMEGSWRNVVTDAAKTSSARAMTMTKSESTLEEIEAMTREVNSSHLSPARDKIIKLLEQQKKDEIQRDRNRSGSDDDDDGGDE